MRTVEVEEEELHVAESTAEDVEEEVADHEKKEDEEVEEVANREKEDEEESPSKGSYRLDSHYFVDMNLKKRNFEGLH